MIIQFSEITPEEKYPSEIKDEKYSVYIYIYNILRFLSVFLFPLTSERVDYNKYYQDVFHI